MQRSPPEPQEFEALRRKIRELTTAEDDRRRVEETLAFERAQLLSLFDSIDEVIYVADPTSYRVLYVNRFLRGLLGRDPVGSLCYREFQNLPHPCDFCTNPRLLARKDVPVRWEQFNPVLGRHYMVVDRIIQWPDGRDVRFELAVDITDRKRAEQGQESRFLRWRRQQGFILELSLHQSVAEGGVEGALPLVTEGMAAALEVERASVWFLNENGNELRCADLFEKSRNTHAAGAVLLAENHPAYFAAMKTGRAIDAHDARGDPRTREFRDDYLVPLGVTSMLDAAIRVSGRLMGVVCCEHVGHGRRWDTDEVAFAGEVADQVAHLLFNAEQRQARETLRESESRLQAILNAVQAGIVVIDAESLVVVETNPAAMELLGGSREQILGRPCNELICHRPPASCPLADPEAQGETSDQPLSRLDGRDIFVQKTVIPLILNGRRHLLTSFIDVTERKRTQEEIARKAQELAEAKRRLETLVSDTVSREKRMVELKQEVNDLLAAQGREPKYRAPQRVLNLRAERSF